ncbi:MAG TPA: EVE domain-containing protein [Pyrinomonadaceae bacterium]|nr:EVE domain-containing protein [Pyrinomonadaceae bacterium]
MIKKKKPASTPPASSKSKPASQYWLVKQEPEGYSWDDLVRERGTEWTGVRNFQARNNLRQMKVGDRVLFYHSGEQKAVVGVAQVAKAPYPDPTADEAQWVAVDIKPLKPLREPVPLTAIRAQPKLSNLSLIRQSRLSVMPVTKEEFETIVALGERKKPRKQ